MRTTGYEAALAQILLIKDGKADVVGNRAVRRDCYFYVEGFKNRPMSAREATLAALKPRKVGV